MSLSIKRSIEKYTTKVGYIIGPNVEYANRDYYADKMMALTGFEEQIIEIKPKMVYEKDSDSFCLVVYSVIDKKDKVDEVLQEIEVRNGQYFRYISFKHLSSEIKLASLYVNDVNNV